MDSSSANRNEDLHDEGQYEHNEDEATLLATTKEKCLVESDQRPHPMDEMNKVLAVASAFRIMHRREAWANLDQGRGMTPEIEAVLGEFPEDGHLLEELKSLLEVILPDATPPTPEHPGKPIITVDDAILMRFGIGLHPDYTVEAARRTYCRIHLGFNTGLALRDLMLGMYDTDRDDIMCAICMAGVEIGSEVLQLPCGHWFDTECIAEWLCESDNCPLCAQRAM